MFYYLVFLVLVSVISVILMWKLSKNKNLLPIDEILQLSTSDNYLLYDWYKNLEGTQELYEDDNVIAARLIENLYGIKICPDFIVIGNNIKIKYYKLTGRKLVPGETFFDIRSAVGLEGEICVIKNVEVRNILQKNAEVDCMDEIRKLVGNNLDKVVRDYLENILRYRWNKILELNDSNVLNDEGSYLYVKSFPGENVETKETPYGRRINLLCKDKEFETMISRWNYKQIP